MQDKISICFNNDMDQIKSIVARLAWVDVNMTEDNCNQAALQDMSVFLFELIDTATGSDLALGDCYEDEVTGDVTYYYVTK